MKETTIDKVKYNLVQINVTNILYLRKCSDFAVISYFIKIFVNDIILLLKLNEIKMIQIFGMKFYETLKASNFEKI
jgi:hypothetical protein